MERTLERQKEQPTPILSEGRKKLWAFHDRFYWDDEELEQADIYALIFARERRKGRQLEAAYLQMQVEESGTRSRVAIPREVRKAVFERDEGKCVECGSSFDIQYDHILPFSRGGANSVENLCLRCGECNRRKSDSL